MFIKIYDLLKIINQSTVPEKQKSSISYFSEDPRKFTQIADLLIFGIGSPQSAVSNRRFVTF